MTNDERMTNDKARTPAPFRHWDFVILSSFVSRYSSLVSLFQILKPRILNRILPPVAVVEVPPFHGIDAEALGFECVAQQVAVPALERSFTEIIGERPIAEFVVIGE